MRVKDVAKLPPTDRFLYWVEERHAIYTRRKAGKPKPWTDDEVLQRYFFTNPYREHDKTTVWFRENVREPLRNSPAVLMATVIFRWFNWIPTGKLLKQHKLLTKWNVRRCLRLLNGVRGKVFTGAYVVNARHGPRQAISRTKIDVCCERINNLWCDRKMLVDEIHATSLHNAHKLLGRYSGLGGTGFAAYEIVSDLRHTYLLEGARDINEWANPGIGALRGFNRLLKRPLKDRAKDWNKQTRRLLALIRFELTGMPLFEMREVEHSLCEFDKYERILFNQGTAKRKYNGS